MCPEKNFIKQNARRTQKMKNITFICEQSYEAKREK